MYKAANVIKITFKISKNRKKRLHKKVIFFLLLKEYVSLFKNENKIVHFPAAHQPDDKEPG